METFSLLAPNASIEQKCCRQRCSLFLLVFTMLRTAVYADFVYSIDGMLCNLFWLCSGIQHDSELHQHDCVLWCHHLCLVLSCRHLDCVDATRVLSATGVGLLSDCSYSCSDSFLQFHIQSTLFHCWSQTLPLRGNVVPAKLSASGSRDTPFQSDIKCNVFLPQQIARRMKCCQARTYPAGF